MTDPAIRIGTAGSSIPAACRLHFPGAGTLLERYAGRLNAAEINSSFYRPHKRATYERWAASTPTDFRFAVKTPKAATHERRLAGCEDVLDRFTDEIDGLGAKLAVVLVQLPPSLMFDAATVSRFMSDLHERTAAAITCEPRHASWFTAEADAFLASMKISRAAADPQPAPAAGVPGGWDGLAYYRLHGAPRMYWSNYDEEAVSAIASGLARHAAKGTPAWCIFDNTAGGCALPNALSAMTAQRSCQIPPAA